jgi:hypothetical protein
MSTAFSPNTTCDVYRSGNSPPAAPDVAGVGILLLAAFDQREERGEGRDKSFRYTHLVYCDLASDIRDGWSETPPFGSADTIYVPDRNGTPFRVVYVERTGYGGTTDCRRAYVDRKQPTWPTNEV